MTAVSYTHLDVYKRQVSTADAALLTLTTFEHYSPAQAAAALGISDGARLHRARARMATALGASLAGDCDNTTKEEPR